MQSVIWKFPIKPGLNEIELPHSAWVLSVQLQFEEPQMWVMLDPEAPRVKRFFMAIGTGQKFIPLERGMNYIGTFQMCGGSLVWHLFETWDALEHAPSTHGANGDAAGRAKNKLGISVDVKNALALIEVVKEMVRRGLISLTADLPIADPPSPETASAAAIAGNGDAGLPHLSQALSDLGSNPN